MKIKHLFTAGLLAVVSTNALGWGQTGHRITGAIAERYLSDNAEKAIEAIYPHASLAEISTHADEMRSHPSEFWQKTASPWHYVTVPKGKVYKDVGAPSQGDAYTALTSFTNTLKNSAATQEEKRLALHFLVHIIGDLHQPLHAGNGTDKGGNDVKVEFFWQDSNLHRVWDSGLIDKQQLSYSEWTNWLSEKISKKDITTWSKATPYDWINESAGLRDGVYPDSKKLSWHYQFEHLPTVKQRLQMAGVRIAAYLNDIYK
ncbi:S1/P1 nuclease [Aestuariibacter sp. AA17]|uniref:S1/P1 nuclease n=1 Tax=Fluctibacter corallii TaxID=2984329 RepID=A0ABT3AC42_9ALTE|nr:S1/P1 nuclease [Aestuariibacter sp. AA17]MCV2886242.1 S1/P1 nuclease [Aestuariibacter sp. AA17]